MGWVGFEEQGGLHDMDVAACKVHHMTICDLGQLASQRERSDPIESRRKGGGYHTRFNEQLPTMVPSVQNWWSRGCHKRTISSVSSLY